MSSRVKELTKSQFPPKTSKYVVGGIADDGLPNAQFMGVLDTGIVKNTTTTGVQSIAIAADFPTLNQNTTGTAGGLSIASQAQGDIIYFGGATWDRLGYGTSGYILATQGIGAIRIG